MFTFLLLGVTLSSRVSLATIGGGISIEILGFDSVDAKIYWLEWRNDEGDELPRAFFARTTGLRAGEPVLIRSWYKSGSGEDWEAMEARVMRHHDALRSRLQPLKVGSLAKWSLGGHIIRTAKHVVEDFPEIDRFDVRLTVGYKGRVRAKLGVRMYTRAQWQLDAVYDVPNSALDVVVISYIGIAMEGGYRQQRIIVAPPASVL